MRHQKSIAFLLALAVSTLAAANMALAEEAPAAPVEETTGPSFVDADGDGVCDNSAKDGKAMNRGRGKRFVDEDGDGVCDSFTGKAQTSGKGMGQGRGFVDADGDGVCDNMGTRRGLKRGQTDARHEANFIDRDGDGVCDNMGKGMSKNRGRQNRTGITGSAK